MTIRVRRWAVVLVLVAAAGCGGQGQHKTAVVRGTVKYKGKPVPNGTVNFIPEGNGPSATGELGPDGTYTLTTYKSGDGAVLGRHKVVIVAMQDQAGKLPEERSPTPPPIVPTAYTSPATTPLTAEVGDKENVIDFDLVDNPAPPK
jgi:hypothetical protein